MKSIKAEHSDFILDLSKLNEEQLQIVIKRDKESKKRLALLDQIDQVQNSPNISNNEKNKLYDELFKQVKKLTYMYCEHDRHIAKPCVDCIEIQELTGYADYCKQWDPDYEE